MSQNYRVTCFLFGRYPQGSVVPHHVAEAAGDVADLIARNTLTPTDDPVNVEVVIPAAAAPDVSEEMKAAHARLTTDHAELQRTLKGTQGELARALGRVKLLEAEVLAKTAQAGEYKAKCDELHKELEQATAPAK